MSGLNVAALSVQIEGNRILNDVSFAVERGSVTAVLGPSGSGKSTLLRAIAGFVASSGTIELEGRSLAAVPAHRRGIGLMFQSHALFPHLTVEENVGFGLAADSVDRPGRIQQLLQMVELEGFGGRSVGALSGGEAQRVALARALAPEPALLMLDEPLGSLDRRLREELSGELSGLLRKTETTALYVTHDQEEAAIVADQLLILEEGAVAAVGEPEQLWRRPPTPWIARFLGHPNVSEARVVPVTAVRIGGAGGLPAAVETARFVDGVWRLTLRLGDGTVLVGHSSAKHQPGQEVNATVDADAVHTFGPHTFGK